MKTKLLLAGFALALTCLAPLAAQEVATPAAELKALVAQTQIKIKAGQKTAGELAPELEAFDALLAKYAAQKTDEVAQIAYKQAMLYAQVLHDNAVAEKILARIVADFPGTRSAAAARTALHLPEPGEPESGGAPAGPQKLASGQEWLTDFEAAKALAAKEGKKLLMDFTGSDWCGFCIKLHQEVFATPEFAAFAKDYVLVELDYPRKHPLPAAEKEQNDRLKAEYKPSGFPTVVVADATGRELARKVGYGPGSGPAKYLAALGKTE